MIKNVTEILYLGGENTEWLQQHFVTTWENMDYICSKYQMLLHWGEDIYVTERFLITSYT